MLVHNDDLDLGEGLDIDNVLHLPPKKHNRKRSSLLGLKIKKEQHSMQLSLINEDANDESQAPSVQGSKMFRSMARPDDSARSANSRGMHFSEVVETVMSMSSISKSKMRKERI